MHPPTMKRQDIKYTTQPPRKRRGFFHSCYFPMQLLFYLTKVNRIISNNLIINSLQLHFINPRLKHFAHFPGNYLTFSDRKHLTEAILTYYLIILLTYYPFNPLTLSCRPK